MKTGLLSLPLVAIGLLGVACGDTGPGGPSQEDAADVRSGEDAGSADGDEAGRADSGTSCVSSDVSGLSAVAPGGWDPLGFPPYALDGCTLVYVAFVDGGSGDLRRRDLSTGREEALAPGSDSPRRPAVADQTVAWEVTVNGKTQVRVWHRGVVRTLAGAFDHAGEPRAASGAVAFTAWLGAGPNDDTDVYVYDADNDALTVMADGPGQQRFADISATHVAVSDFSEDPRGYFDEQMSLSDIVVFERSTRTRIERRLPGKQAFPMLGSGGLLGYLEWRAIHPEPKFGQFYLKRGTISGLPIDDVNIKGNDVVRTDPAYVRPSVHGTNLDFIDTSTGSALLQRTQLDGTTALAVVARGESGALLGPVAAESMTLIGVPRGFGLDLRGVAR